MSDCARLLARQGFTKAVIKGYTASSGKKSGAEFRKQLSQQRTKAVASVMREQWRRMGVRVKLKLRAQGGHDPVGNNSTMIGRAKNRRATINIR